jgi:hypothetical protein
VTVTVGQNPFAGHVEVGAHLFGSRGLVHVLGAPGGDPRDVEPRLSRWRSSPVAITFCPARRKSLMP